MEIDPIRRLRGEAALKRRLARQLTDEAAGLESAAQSFEDEAEVVAPPTVDAVPEEHVDEDVEDDGASMRPGRRGRRGDHRR